MRRDIAKKFVKFSVVGGVGFLIAYTLLYVLTEFAGFWYMLSAIFAQVAATIWNFTANYKWTFRQKNVQN
jgi:dolichol-phosphate mannosyltransferase